jgi:sirohydrochlorin cobaltochelatase
LQIRDRHPDRETMPAGENETGLLLVGHGTRSITGTKQFLDLAEQLAQRIAPSPLEPAFLEMQQPTIAEAVERLLARNIQRLIVMPMLLFAAGHAKRDIPQAVQAALAGCLQAGLPWVQAAHLGCHPAMLELSRRRMAEVLAGKQSIPTEESCLLLVGRGSPDESATAEMQEFARLRQQHEGGLRTDVAFLAMARPLLHECLNQLAAASFRRVIVQPHLLFDGDLAELLRRQVESTAKAHPEQDWLVTPLLADKLGEVGCGMELLVEAILARCQEAVLERQ